MDHAQKLKNIERAKRLIEEKQKEEQENNDFLQSIENLIPETNLEKIVYGLFIQNKQIIEMINGSETTCGLKRTIESIEVNTRRNY